MVARGALKRERTMTDAIRDLPESIQHYVAMWNEPDLDAIRGHLNRAVSTDCLWVDPQHSHVGRDALEANVRRFRTKFGPAELCLASNVDSHHQRYRYEWVIKSEGAVVFRGFDVATLNDDGLIERVDGFFGELTRID